MMNKEEIEKQIKTCEEAMLSSKETIRCLENKISELKEQLKNICKRKINFWNRRIKK